MTEKILRFAHLGDVHLGYGFSYLPAEKRATRKKEVCETFTRMVDEVVEAEVDLVLIAGDLLENELADKSMLRFARDNLARIKCPVLLVAGNHDPLLSGSPYLQQSWPDNLHLFREADWEVLHLENIDTTVMGLSYYLPEENSHRLTSLPSCTSTFKIVLVHGSFSEISTFTSSYLPISRDEVDGLDANYLALGHYHNFQPIFDAAGRLKGCYPGSLEPLDFNETGLHGFVLGEITAEATKVKLIPVARRSYARAEVDVSGSETMQDIRDRIIEVMQNGPEEGLWGISLTGEVETNLSLDSDWLYEELNEKAFFIKIRSGITPAYNLEEFKQRPGVLSYFINHMENMQAQAETERDKMIIKKALATGLDALIKGEVKKR